MNALLVAATVVVTCALAAYSVSFIRLASSRRAGPGVRGWQTAGAGLDIAATAMMIAGSSRIPLTWHGCLGYTALSLMLAETVALWVRRSRRGPAAPVKRNLFRYSAGAYAFWCLTYVAGAVSAIVVARGGR
jgi:hypothetical protein